MMQIEICKIKEHKEITSILQHHILYKLITPVKISI